MTLDEWKAMRTADVQFELERRSNAAVSDYTLRKGFRRALQILNKGNGASNTEKTELATWNTTFAVLDPIEVAAQAAKDRINAADRQSRPIRMWTLLSFNGECSPPPVEVSPCSVTGPLHPRRLRVASVHL
jgi:hypothetical protein